MSPETITALKNYDSIIRNKGFDGVLLHWESGTLAEEHGGYDIEVLIRPGFTPATREGETNE